jgi:hypothetical protein
MNAFQLVGKFLMLKHPVQVSTIRSDAIMTAVYKGTVLRVRVSLQRLWQLKQQLQAYQHI